MLRDVLIGTGRTLLDIIVVSALAGIVIGALQLSGIGMGMPTTVVYVMLAVMVAPALVQTGVPPLAAHLFVFYFGMLSMITPPVCMATIAASALARASFWRTAIVGMRLGAVGYLVPFFLVFHPALLLGRDTSWLTVVDVVAATVGVCFLSFSAAGYLFRPLAVWMRAVFVLAGMALMSPISSIELQLINLAGAVAGFGLAAFLWWISGSRVAVATREAL